MKKIEGNIVDVVGHKIIKGRIEYTDKIVSVTEDLTVQSDKYILPGLVDAHVHIESSMCLPVRYSEFALKHGVVAAITDPHEIANVCGVDGVKFMVDNSKNTPMKLFFGAPSCVPATPFETSGAVISSTDIEYLFRNNVCTHLSEMMNFPGLLAGDIEVHKKLSIAKKYNKVIDGHAPLLRGKALEKYYNSGVSTDHECTNIDEAVEKIKLGFKIMLRKSSASNDFKVLYPLIKDYPDSVMLCTDDCHPDDLVNGYINEMVKFLLNKGFNIFDILKAATLNARKHFSFDIGLLQINDSADFIVVDNLNDFNIELTVIDGKTVCDDSELKEFFSVKSQLINRFFINQISESDLQVEQKSKNYRVIDIVENSLLTHTFDMPLSLEMSNIVSDTESDILKIVVLNRYEKAKPAIGFIRGFNIKNGAIATTVAHDSHNIVAVGVSDIDIAKAITEVQNMQGGMVYVNNNSVYELPLPVAGLMSDKPCDEVARQYEKITDKVKQAGSTLHAPFMTLSFMSLLVIPELKLGDKGLFDVNKFEFTNLQF
ncbi:MAG: adenine deaminase [Prolixibacteraceae bacterium]|jgi:adenine deaminase|nr:adenine deaminase [Prolixibacteraceae bacterium]